METLSKIVECTKAQEQTVVSQRFIESLSVLYDSLVAGDIPSHAEHLRLIVLDTYKLISEVAVLRANYKELAGEYARLILQNNRVNLAGR